MRPVQSSTVVRLSSAGTALLDSIQQRRARAGVVGLGYVGLPLAVELGRAGLQVTGIELDQRKVDAVEAGTSYVPDVPTSDVRELREAGRLRATMDFSVIRELDTIALNSVDINAEELARHDCVVILTDHAAFDYQLVIDSARLVVDTRNALGPSAGPHVFRLGAPSQGRIRRAVEAA